MTSPIPAGNRLLSEELVNLGRLLNPPRARLLQSSGQAVTTGTFTAVTFTSEEFDTVSGHSNVSNTSRYTCQVAGLYLLSGKVAWVHNTTGQRASLWRINGSTVTGSQISLQTNAQASREIQVPAATITVPLAVNDYVELFGFQDSGGSLNTSVGDSATQSFLQAQWIGTG